MPRYLLAYSGGLDTSVMLKWLQLRHGAEVFTMTADLGQTKELKGVREKALATGAKGVYIEDLREEFVRDFVWPSLKAGALYQEVYPMATSLGRPLIAKRLVEIAREVGADAIAHGCTGKGNDQVRLEVGVACLAPDLKCIAPLREWELKSREDEIAYADEHKIPIVATQRAPYSLDENLWGMAIEAGVLEDLWRAPPEDCWQLTVDPKAAPAAGTSVVIGFDAGIPVSLDGKALGGPELIAQLNELASAHGVGRLDVIEDRLVGIKSREVYEAPAALTLHAARVALEQICLDRDTRRVKADLGQQFARLVYDGLWFTPLRKSIGAFVDDASRRVTGDVRMELCQGRAFASGRRSPYALYDEGLATYSAGDTFQHGAAKGFIDIYALAPRSANMVERKAKEPATSKALKEAS